MSIYKRNFLLFLIGITVFHKLSAHNITADSNANNALYLNSNLTNAQLTTTAHPTAISKIWQQYKKRIISLVATFTVFLVIRSPRFQGSVILQLGTFDESTKKKIRVDEIPDLKSYKAYVNKKPQYFQKFRTFLIAEDGQPTIQGYFWKDDDQKSAQKIILHFKGNSESFNNGNKHSYTPPGYDLVEMDYPNTGASEGKVKCEEDFTNFAERCYEYVVKQGYKHIIIQGFSLGCYSASHIAAKYCNDDRINREMLLLESGFSALHNFQGPYLAFLLRCILHYRMDNIKNLAKVTCPIVMTHGKNDYVVHYSNAEEIYASVKNQCRIKLIPHEGYHCPANKDAAMFRTMLLYRMIQIGWQMNKKS